MDESNQEHPGWETAPAHRPLSEANCYVIARILTAMCD